MVGEEEMTTVRFLEDGSPSKVRILGVIKVARNLSFFVSFCYAINSLYFAFDAFVAFVYFTWKYIPVIVTGVRVEKISARSRGVTILLGLVFLFLIIIAGFLAVKY